MLEKRYLEVGGIDSNIKIRNSISNSSRGSSLTKTCEFNLKSKKSIKNNSNNNKSDKLLEFEATN